MARYHENILFTIQKLCFHAAKATKISIFWYPKTPTKQLSSRAGAKSSSKAAQQSSSKAAQQQGAKPAAKQPSWCQDGQDIMISSRARGILSNSLASPGLPGGPKIDHFGTQIPKWPDVTKTYYLLYKSYVFMLPEPPKYRLFGTQKHQQSS